MLNSIRHAIHEAISKNPAKMNGAGIAARMGEGVSTSSLYSWGENKDIPLNRLVQFILITGALEPLAALARLCGCGIYPLPKTDRATETAAMEAIHDFSKFMETHAAAVLDGTISIKEADDIEKRAHASQLAIARIVAAARRRVEDS